jgi:hypothetical protein
MGTPENNFRKALTDKMKMERGKRLYVQKHHGGIFSAGLPDLFLHDLEYGPAFIELKYSAGLMFDFATVTQLQRAVLQQIAASGCPARVVVLLGGQRGKRAAQVALSFEVRALLDADNRWHRDHIESLLVMRTPGIDEGGVTWVPWKGTNTPWPYLKSLCW